MTRFVAFLRAINVGDRTATGDQLVEAAARAGFTEPASFLASGNLVFDIEQSDDLRELWWLPPEGIGRPNLDVDAIERKLGLQTRRTHNTVQRLAAKFQADD